VVLLLLAITIRFVLRRKRERAAGLEQDNPGTAVD
jgi:hypothetical protein